ncbi:alkanesulfonate monooxygenase SsuD/methylene tetrahydromethanopterin reductase-like flavin-dependent oxidoreductase (luciferase family) [Tamaricihabitans halophyticus]|uniref:Alkanesulfonate monooxygenase SsuD/methylene tetrahydromethanopterin reductase-like flavin-dependent oxidoreductase (Luciferase family) n=1 Tax=Tamaricihabitans halophyticus TaxID=1262583 RepID=A0A4R2R0M6_9PSEU|nr:LLM class flavin-dependent oxidoreductase [Tamaricihabitans halophyticus]TCP54998.1 alkanesulfonate monooxygenase SsuD/methylene tetrahydromethanopterin reductase-like flavin-dependent oxidoreductase (luciferase family) [Tamaricihabitans halophyticus]
MKVGLLVNSARQVARQARHAEHLGFDYVAAGEHVFFHGAPTNALTLLAAAAGATERVRLVSSISLLPLYPAALLAKMAVTVDEASGGRLELGIGAGGEFPAEFAACGIDPRSRFRRLDEGLPLLRGLFRGAPVTADGEFARLNGLALRPPPVQPGGPPIWLAGRKPRALSRAGRYADVWIPYLVEPHHVEQGLRTVRDVAEEAGRERTAVYAALGAWMCVDPDAAWARRTGLAAVSGGYQQDFTDLEHYLLLGDPAQVIARLREFAEAGVRTVLIQIAGGDADRDRIIRTIAEQVLPEVHRY